MATLGADYGSRRGHGERALWSAVVQQAIDDAMDEPVGSQIYTEALAFFTHDGDWAQSRADMPMRSAFILMTWGAPAAEPSPDAASARA